MRVADRLQAGLVDKQGAVCETLHGFGAVRHKDDGAALPAAFLEVSEAFFRKNKVPDSQHLVEKKNRRIHLHGNSKCQSHGHTAGVVLDLEFHKVAEFGEFDNALVAVADLHAVEAEDGGVEEDIFATGQLGVEPDTEFKHRRDAPVNSHLAAFVGEVDARENFQEGGLPRSIEADDSEKLAFHDLEADRVECPPGFHFVAQMQFHQPLAQCPSALAGESKGF